MSSLSCTLSSRCWEHDDTLVALVQLFTPLHPSVRSSFVTSLSSVCVAVVAGPPPSSSSVAEDITDDVTLPSNQSSKSRSEAKKQGNTFYLVMPIEQGESMTEDLNEPPTPTASHFPPPVEEVTSPQTQMEEEPAARGLEANQSETMQLEQEKETGHLQAAQHTHVIRNVDEIFHTIEELMTKLRHLKEIEKAHYKLLETLRESSISQESEDQQCRSATVSRTPSLERSSGDGKEGRPAEPKILSTGF